MLIVITINAVNFIDGLDGLAAGVVGIAGLAFLIYSYTLSNSIHLPSQSVPAVASAVLAGICAGFLPHNFHPARIFMGDTGAMLIGLLLAYGPISSTPSLDPSILSNYSLHPLNRFPTILPILLPLAILVIPYTDLALAVIRRTAQGKSPFSPDRKHLHHRLQNMGHSHRQSVLLMYLWAALFSGAVVGLSVDPDPSGLAGGRHPRRPRRAGPRDYPAVAPVAWPGGQAGGHGGRRPHPRRSRPPGWRWPLHPSRTCPPSPSCQSMNRQSGISLLTSRRASPFGMGTCRVSTGPPRGPSPRAARLRPLDPGSPAQAAPPSRPRPARGGLPSSADLVVKLGVWSCKVSNQVKTESRIL